MMESDVKLRIIWMQMKPLVRGRIPYTPDTDETRRLVSLANASFSTFAEMIAFADDWLIFSNDTRLVLNDPNVTEAINVCSH